MVKHDDLDLQVNIYREKSVLFSCNKKYCCFIFWPLVALGSHCLDRYFVCAPGPVKRSQIATTEINLLKEQLKRAEKYMSCWSDVTQKTQLNKKENAQVVKVSAKRIPLHSLFGFALTVIKMSVRKMKEQ